MAANLYEGMFLVDSARFATDTDGVVNHILGILQKAGATITAHRPWQDGRLAYEVDGHRKGLHYLVYFEMRGPGLTDVTRACKLSETVIRHLVIRQPKVLFDAMVEALKTHQTQAPVEDSPRDRNPYATDDRGPPRGGPRGRRPEPKVEEAEAEV